MIHLTWRDINFEIKRCREAADPIGCLENLFQQTKDGMVAFALAEEHNVRDNGTEAARYFEEAEELFPREEWKSRARSAKAQLESTGTRTDLGIETEPDMLFIVQCTKGKIWSNPSESREFVPAKEAYTGGKNEPYTDFVERLKREALGKVRWLYLSAKYGFIEPDHPIANYNVTFSDPNTGPISDETLAHQVRHQWRWKDNIPLSSFRRVVVCGGTAYFCKVLLAFSFTNAKVIDWNEYVSGKQGLDHRIGYLKGRLASLLTAPLLSFRELKKETLPVSPGIYVVYGRDKADRPLYIGRSENLARRIWDNHLRGNVDVSVLRKKISRTLGTHDEDKITEWLVNLCQIRFMPTDESDVIVLEHFAISLLRPALND